MWHYVLYIEVDQAKSWMLHHDAMFQGLLCQLWDLLHQLMT